MKLLHHNLLFFILLLLISIEMHGQGSTESLRELSTTKKGLTTLIRSETSGIPLRDFIYTLASENELNVSIDHDINHIVSHNFYDVSVLEIFSFLAEKYKLDISILNTIIQFKKRNENPIVSKPLRKIDIDYNGQNEFLSVRVENDTLHTIIKTIADKTGKNLILSPEIKNQLITSYILNRPFDQVIEMMARSNSLTLTKDEDGFYLLERALPSNSITVDKSRLGKEGGKTTTGNDNPAISVNENGFLTIKVNDYNIVDLIMETAEKLHLNYFFYNKPENDKTTLTAYNITFEDLLDHILKGKKYTYKKDNNFYLIGEQITEGLRATELIQLENRSIESILTSLPKVFNERLEIKEFIELNAIIVSGYKTVVDELRQYIKHIDKVVPMVQIEVMIVQYNKSYDIQTGIKAGLDPANRSTTQGILFPTQDLNINASSVNSLINAFNGLGLTKLGKVGESFYLSLQALENNSIIKIESTPKIATLSGHEARLAIGETNYYFEQSNQLINSGINNNILQSGTWKSTDANLSINIKPFVSTDENVTLNITVEKSSFLARAGATAPPGKATQKFESLVRVKNNEMVLLGGLDELQKENSGTGVPLLARIPVIKWFFSSKKKSKSNSKLHLFIKTNIIY